MHLQSNFQETLYILLWLRNTDVFQSEPLYQDKGGTRWLANPNYTCIVEPGRDGLGFVTYLMEGDLVTYRANRRGWISAKGDWNHASR